MSYPTPPAKITAFNAPRPATSAEIGLQFDEHSRAIRDILGFMRTIVRDDGLLQNGAVRVEQLDPELSAMIARTALRSVEEMLSGTNAALASMRRHADDSLRRLRDMERLADRVTKIADDVGRAGEGVRQRAQFFNDYTLPAIESRPTPMAMTMGAVGTTGLGSSTTPVGYTTRMTVLDASIAGAQDWAEASQDWAEHMPDIIPGKTLGIMSVTGDHWSSRWWANRSANAFGQLAWLYYGAGIEPPAADPSTGNAIPPGAIWYDTTTNTIMVWNGTMWEPIQGKPIYADTLSLYYIATDEQTDFTLTDVDMHGNSATLTPDGSQGVIVFLNGVRLTPSEDFSIAPATSTMTLAIGASMNSVLAVDVLIPTNQLQPGRVEAILTLNPNIDPTTGQPGQQDGIRTDFGLYVAQDMSLAEVAAPEELLVSFDGVIQSPGFAFTLPDPNTIRFSEPPAIDSQIFIIWFRSPSDPTATTP